MMGGFVIHVVYILVRSIDNYECKRDIMRNDKDKMSQKIQKLMMKKKNSMGMKVIAYSVCTMMLE